MYLNLWTESQRYGKLREFQDISVRPVLLCEEHRYVLVDIFMNLTRWHDEGAIIH